MFLCKHTTQQPIGYFISARLLLRFLGPEGLRPTQGGLRSSVMKYRVTKKKSTKIRRTRNESVCFAQILTKLRRDFRASVGIQKIPSCNYKLCDRSGRSSVPSKCQQFSLRPSSCSKRGRAGPSVCYLSCGGVARCLLPLVLDNIAFIIFIMLVEHDLSWSSPGSAVVDFTALLATL